MNLETTISVRAGGPGSGCKGENCGRLRTHQKETKELLQEHDRIKKHPWRKATGPGMQDRQYKMQSTSLVSLADRLQSKFGNDRAVKETRKLLSSAESKYAQGQLVGALIDQENALSTLHSRISTLSDIGISDEELEKRLKNWGL